MTTLTERLDALRSADLSTSVKHQVTPQLTHALDSMFAALNIRGFDTIPADIQTRLLLDISTSHLQLQIPGLMDVIEEYNDLIGDLMRVILRTIHIDWKNRALKLNDHDLAATKPLFRDLDALATKLDLDDFTVSRFKLLAKTYGYFDPRYHVHRRTFARRSSWRRSTVTSEGIWHKPDRAKMARAFPRRRRYPFRARP